MKKPNIGIVVDGSTRGNPGPSKYRLFDLSTNKIIFESDWIGITTNNVTEFLALCHAIYYVEKNKLDVPIYSDSVTALNWVEKKKANSKCAKLQNRINAAQVFLKSRTSMPVIEKWHTSMWGENPADFGLKK